MTEINNYSQRCEMNIEADILLRFLGLRSQGELAVLSASMEKENEDEEEWEGFIKRMRTFQ